MGNTTAVGLCNTDDMNVVHAMFRHLLGRAVPLVREVRPGDRDRAAIVVAHVREIAHSLHDHHSTEDTLLWDDLAARAPACALDVGLMRSQHATVADQLAALEDPLTRLERTASAAARDDATEALDRVRVTLGEHLGAGEEQILPWVRTTFTQEEWGVLGKVGRSKIAKERMFVQLGHMMAPIRRRGPRLDAREPAAPRPADVPAGRASPVPRRAAHAVPGGGARLTHADAVAWEPGHNVSRVTARLATSS